MSAGAHVSCLSGFYPYRVGYGFRSLRHSRISVIPFSLPPIMEMHVYYYGDGLRWLITDDEHDYIMIMYLPYNIGCYLACSSSG
jgi:hypothetical protein